MWIPTGDLQLRSPEQGLLDPNDSGVTLGVDHIDAGGRDRDVIDVPATERHSPVVEDDGGSLRRPLLEGFADSNLAQLARLERPLVLRLVG